MNEQASQQAPCECGCAGLTAPQPDAPGPKTSKSALWSMICGIAGILLCLPAIPAVILGIIGLVKINKHKGALKGTGMAVTGLILGGLMLFAIPFLLIIAAIASPNITRARDAAMEAKTRADLSTISQSLEIYCADYGVYPATEQGLDALVKNESGHSYLETIPNDFWGRPYRYLYPGVNRPETYDLWSAGKDGVEGTPDDITNWQE
jgi:general secretion pathway protein G